MSEFSEHGPVSDPVLGDDEAPEGEDANREAGSDAAPVEPEEHPQAETPPN